MSNNRVLIRGGGDLASGVAVRLHRAGFAVLMTELPAPLVVRRTVSFAEVVFSQTVKVEEITGRLASAYSQANEILDQSEVAVMVDPDLENLGAFSPLVLVDARMRKRPPETSLDAAPLVMTAHQGRMIVEKVSELVREFLAE